MRIISRGLNVGLIVALLLSTLVVSAAKPSAPLAPSKIEADLHAVLAAGGRADLIVHFGEQADLSAAYTMGWDERGEFVYQTLSAVAAQSQAQAKALLDGAGLAYQTFIAGNELYVWDGSLPVADALAALPAVDLIRAPRTVTLDPIIEQQPAAAPDALAWGITYTNADQFWAAFGLQGQGIKVANIDTGVQWDHPALDQAFACPGDPGNAACWRDPSNICPGGTACDNNGHGTHTMGTMVGDDDPSLTWQAGMAPGATWIACKGCESSSCSEYALNTCADWILAPGGNTADRPHVVNNSWGGGGCNTWYLAKVNAWRAAGTFPAFSAGNSGSGCSTLGSPGDYQESFASAAIASNGTIASFSSRGPSCFGHDPYTKPNIAAPGVSVCSSVPGNGWSCGYSGTSMASPHSAGAVALLWSCNPSLIGQMDATFEALQNSAGATPAGNCGAPPDGEGNYTYGYGYLNVYAAGLAHCGLADEPHIVVTPEALAAEQCPDEVTEQTLQICNLGGAELTWSMSEQPVAGLRGAPTRHAPRITLPDGAPQSLTEFVASGRPAPAAQPVVPGMPVVAPEALTFYADRGAFDADYPGLPVEGYENGTMPSGSVNAVPHPLDEFSDNLYFDPGDILPGIQFWATQDQLDDEIAVLGEQFFGNPSKTAVANYFDDSYRIVFDPPVQATGMDLQEFMGSYLCQVDIYDALGSLLASVTSACNEAGVFWGVASDADPIAEIVITSLGGGAEGADNVAFGGELEPPPDVPWLSADPISGVLPAGECQDVTVTFDSTGMDPGDYFANLLIDSNDPVNPQVVVPVQLTVDPCGLFDASKEAPATAEPGDVISYTITIAAGGVYMEDPLPAGVQFAGNLQSNVGTAWYDADDNTVYWQDTVEPPASAPQPAVDETLGRPAPAIGLPAPLGPLPDGLAPANGTLMILDDFNRADGPIGPNWTVHDGYCNVSNNAAVCGGMARATYNDAPGDGYMAEADVATVGTSLQYTGLLLNYGAGSTNLFLKVQQQNSSGQFEYAACYTGNNGAGFGLGFFALNEPFSTAHMRATRVGNDVTIEFTDVDGGAKNPQTYVCAGAPPPEGTGIGILGYDALARLDNFGLPGEGPEQAVITFDVEVTGDCGQVIVNQGWATDDETVVDFAAETEVVCLGAPEIVVTPASLEAALCPDETETVELSICNLGQAPLLWEIEEMEATALRGSMPFVPVNVAGEGVDPGLTAVSPPAEPVAVPPSPQDVLWDQPLSTANQNAYVNQQFPDAPDYSSFLADDFVNAEPWEIQSIFVPGNGWNGYTTIMNATALTWQIYADDGGAPDGDPSGAGNPPVWTLTLAPNDAQVVVTNGSGGMPSNVQLNLATPGQLPPGHWWLVFYPTMEFGVGGQYGRQPADTTNGHWGQFVNPGGGFGYGTAWQSWSIIGADRQDIAFRIEGVTGAPPVDIPWLSAEPTAGIVAPGECMTVAVTFDATGMDPGDYWAGLKVLSNDPETPEVIVPVTMTVLAPAEIIEVTYQIDGLEVTFTSAVVGSEPIDYLWDFGDDSTSTDPNPVHLYAEGGCYTVTLWVENACGADSWSVAVCVETACVPVDGVDFTWQPEVGIVGEAITFYAEVVTGTLPYLYTWDFGDGAGGEGIEVSHTYQAAGVYTVTLWVENACGEAMVAYLVTVEAGARPIFIPVLLKNY